MKNEDKMIDALLQEHARKGDKDDAEFITSLEERLDEEEGVVNLASTKRRSSSKAGIGLGIAAALTVAAVGYYGWNEKRETDLAVNDSYEAEAQKASISHLEMQGRNETRLAKTALKSESKLSHSGEKMKMAVSEPVMDESVASDLAPSPLALPAVPKPRVSQKNVTKREMTRSYERKPSAPSSGMAKEIAAKTKSSFDVPSGRKDGLDFGNGWGSEDEDEDGDGGGGGFGRLSKKSKENEARSRYSALTDNTFKSPWSDPLSTFSVDVDTASYTNVRRMIQSGQAVPKDSVRIEEMINYFNYSYPQPAGEHPFSVNVETASCPWNAEHRLVKIGLKGKDIIREQRPAANLVFLLDVSGSMNSQDKLPLLVDSMKILLKELNADDSVSIVVYAGAQGLALPPTYVDENGRKVILNKLNNFRSGGSTNGGAGINLAYKMAKKHFVKGGVNRVILGTDGDFNVGVTGTDSLVNMVEREAKSGVFMSVLGFGQGNLNDNMLEKITNKGNGNYFYIDNLREGRKVFLDDMMGTMVTIAKDVKIQIEFNPTKVKSYRLIGYANRMLKAEDFKNKLIDAGEIGSGHTVTAFYEVVPGNANQTPAVDDLEYQKKRVVPKPVNREAVDSPNMLTVKLAYKQPEATKETESTYFRTRVVANEKTWQDASADFKFAASVSLFGMLQRQSEHAGQGTYQLVRKLAEAGRGDDPKGLRTEFSDLVRKVK